MKLIRYFLVTVMMMGLVVTGFSVYAQQTSGVIQNNQLNTNTTNMPADYSGNAFRSSNILGSMVENRQGDELGSIDDLIIDIDNGRIVFVVMGSGGFLGLGEDLYAIPWEELEAQPDAGIFILDVTQDTLEGAPGFSVDNWPAIRDQRWAEDTRNYWSGRRIENQTNRTNTMTNQTMTNQQTQAQQGVVGTNQLNMPAGYSGNAFRSSNILGSAVENRQGEQLGEIDDLIIDMDNGRIAFVIMNCCGFLGFGEDLYAIPWEELEAQPDTGIFILNVSKQTLGEAPGFSANNWPAIQDQKWAEDTRNYWSGRRIENQTNRTNTMTNQQTQTQERVVQNNQLNRANMPAGYSGNVFRSSNILGSMVENRQGDELGSIDDLIIDIDNGRIAFVVMGSGGFLGMGEDLYAIPWEELEAQPDAGIFILDVSQETLEGAPGFSVENWPAIRDQRWAEETRDYWAQGRL